MSARPSTRTCLRAVALVLLLWSVADGALYGVCAGDPARALTSVETRLTAAGGTHGDGPLHAHHCFCRAQWIGIGGEALLAAPDRSPSLVARRACPLPDAPARHLDRPPQLNAA